MLTSFYFSFLLLFSGLFPAGESLNQENDCFPPRVATMNLTEPDDLSGILELRIGTPFNKVKKLLEPTPIHGYFSDKNHKDEIAYARQEGNTQADIDKMEKEYEANKEINPKDWYRVKIDPRHFDFFGRQVLFIEVQVDKENLISRVTLFLERTTTNLNVIIGAMGAKFGQTPCAVGTEDDSYLCIWEDEAAQCMVYNSNGQGLAMFEDFVYVDFMRLGAH